VAGDDCLGAVTGFSFRRLLAVPGHADEPAQLGLVGLDEVAPYSGAGERTQVQPKVTIPFEAAQKAQEPPPREEMRVIERPGGALRRRDAFLLAQERGKVAGDLEVLGPVVRLAVQVELHEVIRLRVGESHVEGTVEAAPETLVHGSDPHDLEELEGS